MKAIILCGGLGTRLRSVVSEVPKSMAPINGRPFLEYQLNNLKEAGVDTVIFAVGYKKEFIEDYFGNKYRGMNLLYSEEDKPLGTGGALKKAFKLLDEDRAIMMNGDNYVDVDYKKLYQQHLDNNMAVTIVVKPMEDFDRYGNVIVENNRVKQFIEKQPTKKGLISVGCLIVNKNIFDNTNLGEEFSIEKDYLMQYAGKVPMGYFIYDGYFIDIGRPDDYFAFENYIKNS